jgi:hypothetical protein
VKLADLLLGEDDLEWQSLASCRGIDGSLLNLFFEDYEADPIFAEQADNLCLSCPVAAMCFEYGLDTQSTGVWGGVYLTRGKVSKSRNAHKTPDIWKKLEAIHEEL